MTSTIKEQIQEDMKTAMRSHDKDRLATIRLILAALKQREVDERIVLTDENVFAILDKMIKQRRQSIEEFAKANRPELVKKETAELQLIQHYLPTQLSSEEVHTLIDATIQETGATSARDMGKVMSALKPKLQGRADMTLVSAQIKERLNS
jgi:uncharacterized protein YqeY